jgi:thiamine biosynthesis lipoprotein
MEAQWETMGMPAKLIVAEEREVKQILQKIKELFENIDTRFSTYKEDSLISRLNRDEITEREDPELELILSECGKTKAETKGYFDCHYLGTLDPSGLVKGYAISQAAKLLKADGYQNFLIEIAGDLQTSGVNEDQLPWQVGIENPFNRSEMVKVVKLSGQGMATSGTAIHPDHIINPLTHHPAHEIASMTVIAPDVYDADRFATAAFAMGTKGIEFIHNLSRCAGYMITNDRQAVMTEEFKQYD